MLKITLVEFFFRTIPESFLMILLVYLICNERIRKKIYFKSSIILAISTYLVRLLPIQFGIHTIIIIMIFVVINNQVSKISIKKSIAASMIAMIALSICESANFFILSFINVDMGKIYDNVILKIVYFTPSLIFFAIIACIVYFVKNKLKRGLRNVSN